MWCSPLEIFWKNILHFRTIKTSKRSEQEKKQLFGCCSWLTNLVGAWSGLFMVLWCDYLTRRGIDVVMNNKTPLKTIDIWNCDNITADDIGLLISKARSEKWELSVDFNEEKLNWRCNVIINVGDYISFDGLFFFSFSFAFIFWINERFFERSVKPLDDCYFINLIIFKIKVSSARCSSRTTECLHYNIYHPWLSL